MLVVFFNYSLLAVGILKCNEECVDAREEPGQPTDVFIRFLSVRHLPSLPVLLVGTWYLTPAIISRLDQIITDYLTQSLNKHCITLSIIILSIIY